MSETDLLEMERLLKKYFAFEIKMLNSVIDLIVEIDESDSLLARDSNSLEILRNLKSEIKSTVEDEITNAFLVYDNEPFYRNVE